MKRLLISIFAIVLVSQVYGQFKSDSITIKNPMTNNNETVVGRSIQIYFGDIKITDNKINFVDSSSYIDDVYVIYTYNQNGEIIYTNTVKYRSYDYDKLKQWEQLINDMVAPAKRQSDSLNYIENGYKTERKAFR